jgi:hypothetical protein
MSEAALAAMIDRLRSLATLPREAAKEAAPLVEEAAKATVAAGTSPDGEAWKPTKEGGKPLQNAAKAVSAVALGPVVQIRVDGVEALHHNGTKRLPRRQLIPYPGDSLSKTITRALEAGAAQAFQRMIGGGK